MVVHELCICCGSRVEQKGVKVVVGPSPVVLSEHEAKRRAEERTQRLIQEKKLMLVLDIDQTLLHATPDPEAAVLMNFSSAGHEIYSLSDHEGRVHHVKMRPYLGLFLRTVAPFFQLCIYTAGVRSYADAVVEILDPDWSLISRSDVISRDECADLSHNTKVCPVSF